MNSARGGLGPFDYHGSAAAAGNLSHRSNPSQTTIIGGDFAAKMTTYKRAYAGTVDEDISHLMVQGRGTQTAMVPPNQTDQIFSIFEKRAESFEQSSSSMLTTGQQ